MAADTLDPRQHARELIDQLGPHQMAAVVQLLEVMVEPDDDEPLSEEDRRAIAASREEYRRNPDGFYSLEQVAAECGITMDQIRDHKG
jgi:hypothetical protein